MATALSSPRLQPSGTHEAVGPETSLRGYPNRIGSGGSNDSFSRGVFPCGWWRPGPGAGGRPGPGPRVQATQSYRFAGESFDDVADQVAGSWGDRVACWPYLDARVPIHW